MNKVLKGKKVWDSKKSKMTAQDWIAVGEALLIGKGQCSGKPAFGKWCKDNGFGDIDRRVRTDAMWLASDEGRDYMTHYGSMNKASNPKVIHAAYRIDQKEKIGVFVVAVHNAMGKRPQTVTQLADKVGLEREQVRRCARLLVERGSSQKHGKGKECKFSKVEGAPLPQPDDYDSTLKTAVGTSIQSTYKIMENLANHSKDAPNARRRLKAAVGEHWGGTHHSGRTTKVLQSKASVTQTLNIGGMTKAAVTGTNGKVRLTVTVEVIE